MRQCRATAPGGIGNLGPGLDVLGCAIAGRRDEVTAQWWDAPGVTIIDPGHPELPASPAKHTAAIAANAVMRAAMDRGVAMEAPGIALTVKKGLPLSGGQGGSAASAVAGAAAADGLLQAMLSIEQLIHCCLVAEATVAGRHLDNIAPAMLGGIVLVRKIDPVDVIRLPVPTGLCLVLAHPAQRLSTASSRQALPSVVGLGVVTHQLAQVAAMVAACFLDDLALFGKAIDDRIAEPARAALIPGFVEAKHAAMHAGALGTSISGAGPTAFAIAGDALTGERIAEAMYASYAAQGIACSTIVTEIDREGVIVDAD